MENENVKLEVSNQGIRVTGDDVRVTITKNLSLKFFVMFFSIGLMIIVFVDLINAFNKSEWWSVAFYTIASFGWVGFVRDLYHSSIVKILVEEKTQNTQTDKSTTDQ